MVIQNLLKIDLLTGAARDIYHFKSCTDSKVPI